MKEREPQAPPPRELAYDYEYPFHGLWTPGGICRIRIYEAAATVPVVIATEVPENHNTSVTNMAECLAAEILEQHFPERIGLLAPTIWLEHYPERLQGLKQLPECFDLVTFERSVPEVARAGNHWRKTLGTPTWKHLGKEDVERIIGRPWPDQSW